MIHKSMFKRLKEKFRNKDGEMLTHTVLTIITYFILTVIVVNVLVLTFHYFSLHYIASSITRVIEREGGLTNEAYDMLEELNDDFHTTAAMTNSLDSKIQYMDKFEVIIEDEHTMTIMTPMGLDPLEYDFPMTATITGMSEVYWKELL